MSAKVRIAIIGAGPAGCTLAKLLLVSDADVEIVIFEGEASLDARTQGGTLDLHTDTGLAALKKAGLYDEFVKLARFDGEAFIVCTKHFKKMINLPGASEGSSRGRPEIDRIQLRRLLLDSLPKELIKWDHRLQTISFDELGKPSLHFSHGVESGFDLVVGGDGAWSKVRPYVSTVKPFYSGIAGTNLLIPHAEKRQPELWKLVNRGSVFAMDENKAIISQQLSTDGALLVSTWKLANEDWKKEANYDTNDAAAFKAVAAKEFATWDPCITDLVAKADEESVVSRNLYMLPVGHNWPHRPHLTLLGDAAHVMTPFAGEGVNLAMQDAMRLADAIVAASKSVSPSSTPEQKIAVVTAQVQAFEEDMFVRATAIQRTTEAMMRTIFFSQGGLPNNIQNWVYEAVQGSFPSGTKWLLRLGATLYFAYWRRKNL